VDSLADRKRKTLVRGGYAARDVPGYLLYMDGNFRPGGRAAGKRFRPPPCGLLSTMFTRKQPVQIPGFPAADHLEITGVYPDVVVDYLTRNNLMTNGKDFIQDSRRL